MNKEELLEKMNTDLNRVVDDYVGRGIPLDEIEKCWNQSITDSQSFMSCLTRRLTDKTIRDDQMRKNDRFKDK